MLGAVLGGAARGSPRSLRVPLAYLREIGAVPPLAPVITDGLLDELLCDYRRYLACERRLAPKTVERWRSSIGSRD